MTRRSTIIPLSETTALASKDVNSLRQHAKVVFQRLEQEISNEEEEEAATAASSIITTTCMPDNDKEKRTNNAASPSSRQRQQQRQQRQHLSWFDKNKNGSSCGSDVDEAEVNDGVDGDCCFSPNNNNNNNNNNTEEEEHEQIGVNVGMGRKEGRRTHTIQDDNDNDNNDNADEKTKKQTNTKVKTSSASLSSSKSSLVFRRQFFDANGFWIARNFCSSSSSDSSDDNNSDRDSDTSNSNSSTKNNIDTTNEIFQLKQAMSELVQHNWFPDHDKDNDTDNDDDDDDKKGKEDAAFTAFGTDAKSNEARGDPFLESADQISYFVEPTAVDPHTGKLKQSIVESNETATVDDVAKNNDHNTATATTTTTTKLSALCKVGHGLHLPHEYHSRRRSTTNSVSVKEKEEHTQTETNTHTNSTTRTPLPTTRNNNPFWNYTTSSKIRDLVISLGYHDPVVPQSMYIFKNPVVGGAVHSHQDSTFLYTTPRQTCLGLWLALDDATLENGCLWVRPKSHLEPVRRQFIRNPLYYKTTTSNSGDNDNDNDHNGTEGEQQEEEKKNETNNSARDVQNNEKSSSSSSSLPSKLVFRHHHHDPKVTWEGKLPDSIEVIVDNKDDKDANDNPVSEHRNDHDVDVDGASSSVSYNTFIPVEVQAGDLVVFCGTLDHFSLPNFSPHQRHTFQLHLVEGPTAGITWSPENWLQYHHHKNNNNNNVNNDDEKGGTNNNNHQEDPPNDFLRLLDYA